MMSYLIGFVPWYLWVLIGWTILFVPMGFAIDRMLLVSNVLRTRERKTSWYPVDEDTPAR